MAVCPRLLLCGLVVVIFAIPANAEVGPCDTLPPRTVIAFDSIASFDGYTEGNDCWGWVSPGGIEYAIYGARGGLAFINLNTMQEDDFVSGPNCIWRDIKSYRNYCYEVTECGPGLKIIDMSFLPDSVHVVGTFTGGSTRSHNLTIDTAKGYAYLVRQNYSGFRVISLANPESPAELPGVNTGDAHDVYARNDTVWAAEGWDSQFSIWDMSNKSSPQMLALVTVPGQGYLHNIWPMDYMPYVVTTEETAGHTIKIWNTADLQDISLVAQYLAPSGLAHNAHIVGKYLFLSHYESGVVVVDLTFPECPVEMARFDTFPDRELSGYNGCWGVYPHAGTNRIYASNIEGSIMIFETDIRVVGFGGGPLVGAAPLSSSFLSYAQGDIVSQTWDFGDGAFGNGTVGAHAYGPGIYDVALDVTFPESTTTIGYAHYVTALAESLTVEDVALMPGQAGYWEVGLINHVPILETTIPVSMSGVPSQAVFDSVSRVGTRTEYFEVVTIPYDNHAGGQVYVRLIADGGGGSPPLAPGTGPILRVYYHLLPTASPGSVLTLSTDDFSGPVGGGIQLDAKTTTAAFVPSPDGGTLTVLTPPCECLCYGDPSCNGVVDVFDVVETVDVAFRAESPTFDFGCPSARTDADCDGLTNVFDVVAMVDVAFRSGDPQTTFCDPCEL